MKETSKQAIANEKEEESELAATLKQTNTRIEQIESVQPNKQISKNNQINNTTHNHNRTNRYLVKISLEVEVIIEVKEVLVRLNISQHHL